VVGLRCCAAPISGRRGSDRPTKLIHQHQSSPLKKFKRQGMARQSRNQRNVASKVARASRPCVSVTGDNFAGTHRRDACATTLPEKSSQNVTRLRDSTAKAQSRQDARQTRQSFASWRLCVKPDCHSINEDQDGGELAEAYRSSDAAVAGDGHTPAQRQKNYVVVTAK